ncbi:EamA-like transporter family protein [compost metagenome]
MYFYLIQSVGAVKTVSVTFLVPVFGLMWGAVFLDEPVYANTLAGLVIILLSVMLVNRKPRSRSIPGANSGSGRHT